MPRKGSKKTNKSVWQVVASRYAINNPWLKVRKEKIRLPSGKMLSDYFTIDGIRIAAVLAMDKKENILLVKQYRHAIKKFTYDIPGGAVDKGETPEATAKREMEEETGYFPRRLKKILSFYPDSGKKGDVRHIFIADRLERVGKAKRLRDADENVIHLWIPLKAVLRRIERGEFAESTLLIAVMYYWLWGKR